MVASVVLLTSFDDTEKACSQMRPIPQSSTCRCLFGPPDVASAAPALSVWQRLEDERASNKWNFDFRSRKPLPNGCRFEWSSVSDGGSTSSSSALSHLGSQVTDKAQGCRLTVTLSPLTPKKRKIDVVQNIANVSSSPSQCKIVVRHRYCDSSRLHSLTVACRNRKRKSHSLLGKYLSHCRIVFLLDRNVTQSVSSYLSRKMANERPAILWVLAVYTDTIL